MDVVVLEERDKADWERFVYGNPDTIAWQSYDWNGLLKRHYRCDFFPLAVYEGGEICGILPIYHMNLFPGGDRLLSVPFAVAGGITADREEIGLILLEKAVELSKRYESCPITLKQYKYRVNGDLGLDENYYNRELDISRDLMEIWEGLAEFNKEQIILTESAPYVLEYPSRDIDLFYRMLLKDYHSRGIPCVSREWIKNLIGFGMYSTAILKSGEKVVAGTLVKEFKDTVSFPFTTFDGSSQEKWAYRLYWELIKVFSSQGKRICHSGRIPNNDETDRYRLGWGGTKFGYYYQYYPNAGVVMEYAARRGKKRRLAEKAWKTLPRFAAGALGPHIVKRFP